MKIEVSTKLIPQVEEENQKKTKRLCRLSLIVGIIGLLAFIIVNVVCLEEGEKSFWLEMLLLFAAMLFALGLVIPLALKIMTKKSMENLYNVVNRYVFEEEYLLVSSYRGEEKIAEAKHYYTEFSKIKKTQNYVYLCLGLRGAYPIEIAALTGEQLSRILSLKKKKVVLGKQTTEK